MKQQSFFKTKMVPSKEGSGRLFDEELVSNATPVTCLGTSFPDDKARRAYFTELLAKKLRDPEFRKIEGFPIGSDEDILKLSDPPYYTACPNPWIADFIAEWEAQKPEKPEGFTYHREPFAADVSEGKNDPIYNAHSYHTKVPHKAIMRYILHYTEPGDIVFDGFCGTGMTGVAAQLCGDRKVVESLGFLVQPDGTILQEETDENGNKTWMPFSRLGARRAVLNDLSPAATFIAYNYNTPVDVVAFEKEAKRILKEVEDECGWMYETYHTSGAGFQPAYSIYKQQQTGNTNAELKGFKITHRNLPHWQYPGAMLFVTFNTLNRLQLSEKAKDEVLSSLKYWDSSKIKLFTAVVMPDHVHMLFKLLQDGDGDSEDLSKIMHSIKSFSANQVNKVMQRSGVVWQNESYDHVIRDERDFHNTLSYIWYNPVKKGLCDKAEDYSWYCRSGRFDEAGWKPALLGKINYTVWSDVFVCPNCSGEVVFWEVALDKDAGKVKDEFPCPHCSASLTKRNMERAWVTRYDPAINETLRQARQVPVLINYTVGKKRYEKAPDTFDLELIEKIDRSEIPYWFPTNSILKGDKTGEPLRIGITHTNHFYTTRNLINLSAFRCKAKASNKTLFLCNSIVNRSTQMNRIHLKNYFFGGGGWNAGYMKGTLYFSSLPVETSILEQIEDRISSISKAFSAIGSACSNIASTCSSTAINIDDCSFDYLFIDPPFGANIMYSELNYLWESWLKVLSNNKLEAIENKSQHKGISEYRQLMTACFKEAYRVLKPGRWMTVEFSNTNASVWNSIQTAMTEAGFIVANVSALDKKQGSFNAVTNTTSVKQDLVISAYKPNGGFEERFLKEVQTEEGVWDFVRTHLQYLPVVKSAGTRYVGKGVAEAGRMPALQFVPERDPRILFDQMVAYYVRKGYPVPISSVEFQIGLSQRFSERDGMYFLPDQVAEYDRKKMISGTCFQQIELFVSDEASAIQWLRQLIKEKPQTFQEINPQFMQQLGGWSKNEAQLDLRELLNQNFLSFDEKGKIPAQIVSWMRRSSELRPIIEKEFEQQGILPEENLELETLHLELRRKASDRWYVPDPNKAGDLEKLREKALLKEFSEYRQFPKKLKVFRLEAVRAGFKKAWQDRDYATIITVAEKIPNNVLEEDPKLLMWYDQAITRMGEE